MRNLYILGTRGIPAGYGGFETFAAKLAPYMVDQGWHVRVYCQSDSDRTEKWRGVECVHLKAAKGAWGSIVFDWRAILHALRHKQQNEVWLTLGYNTAIFNTLPMLLGHRQAINMDGVEWQRRKWSWPKRLFLHINYFFGGKVADVLIADHPEIAAILKKNFSADKIYMIAYGGDEKTPDATLLAPFNVKPEEYCIVIARPEPENNILEIVRVWSQKRRNQKLVVLGNFDSANAYHRQVIAASSSEVFFPGAVYDPDTVHALRHFSAAYIHGHSVGGTNPSLVESMAAQCRIIAHDNVFNRWVAGEKAAYFSDENALATLFENMPQERCALSNDFRWETILAQYRHVLEHTASLPKSFL